MGGWGRAVRSKEIAKGLDAGRQIAKIAGDTFLYVIHTTEDPLWKLTLESVHRLTEARGQPAFALGGAVAQWADYRNGASTRLHSVLAEFLHCCRPSRARVAD